MDSMAMISISLKLTKHLCACLRCSHLPGPVMPCRAPPGGMSFISQMADRSGFRQWCIHKAPASRSGNRPVVQAMPDIVAQE